MMEPSFIGDKLGGFVIRAGGCDTFTCFGGGGFSDICLEETGGGGWTGGCRCAAVVLNCFEKEYMSPCGGPRDAKSSG